MKRLLPSLAILFGLAASAEATPIVVATSNATTLSNAIGGPGITISNPTFTTNGTGSAGTFTGGLSSVGFDTGIVLTTGTTTCVPGPNNQDGCTGAGTFSQLAFDFTSATGSVFFSYVFASEEYNEFVGSQFNDTFQLLLDGTNIALLPGGGGVVSINNVNCGINPAFYRNNDNAEPGCPSLGIDIQYDGLTTILNASGTGLGAGTHNFVFNITDVGDTILDSGVFVQGGSFSGTVPPITTPPPAGVVPEPASMFLMGSGLVGLVARARKRRGQARTSRQV